MSKRSSYQLCKDSLLPAYFGMIVFLTVTIACTPTDANVKLPALTTKSLDALDACFDESFAWWASVYDAESGGCFYSLSGKKARRKGDISFAPDIEASSKLVKVLSWSGLMEQTSTEFRHGIITYMQSRQDQQSGFFRDPEFRNGYNQHKLNRALGMAVNSLTLCGGTPIHPLPHEQVDINVEAAEHFSHLENSERMIAWLDKLPWQNRIWTCGSHIRSQLETFVNMEAPRRDQLLTTVEDYLKKRQNANDGYYGESDNWYSRLSGTYKILSFLHENGRSLPEHDLIRETALNDLRTRDYTNLIVLYNTGNLLTILRREQPVFTSDQRSEVVMRFAKILKQFKTADGGFSTQLNKPAPVANGFLLGKNVVEGNTNATGLAHKLRGLLHEFLTGKEGPHSHPMAIKLIEGMQ